MSMDTVVPSNNGQMKVSGTSSRIQQEDALFNIGDQNCNLFIKLRSGMVITAEELQKQLLKTETETLALKLRPYVMTYGLPKNDDPTKKPGRGLVVRKQYVNGAPDGDYFLLINDWNTDVTLDLSMLEDIKKHIAVNVSRVVSLTNLATDE